MCKKEIVNIRCCEIGIWKSERMWEIACACVSGQGTVWTMFKWMPGQTCAASEANSCTKLEPMIDIFRIFWVKAQNGWKCSEQGLIF